MLYNYVKLCYYFIEASARMYSQAGLTTVQFLMLYLINICCLVVDHLSPVDTHCAFSLINMVAVG
jgi:hypothetical protein